MLAILKRIVKLTFASTCPLHSKFPTIPKLGTCMKTRAKQLTKITELFGAFKKKIIFAFVFG